jgi:hypothetical protein
MKINPQARARRKSAPGKDAAPVTSGQPFTQGPHDGLTAAPVEHDSEWVRLPKPKQSLCGMTRSYLFVLCTKCAQCNKLNCKEEGHRPFVRSITNKLPGKTRGVRLIHRPSLVSFLANLDLAQNGAPVGAQ